MPSGIMPGSELIGVAELHKAQKLESPVTSERGGTGVTEIGKPLRRNS